MILAKRPRNDNLRGERTQCLTAFIAGMILKRFDKNVNQPEAMAPRSTFSLSNDLSTTRELIWSAAVPI